MDGQRKVQHMYMCIDIKCKCNILYLRRVVCTVYYTVYQVYYTVYRDTYRLNRKKKKKLPALVLDLESCINFFCLYELQIHSLVSSSHNTIHVYQNIRLQTYSSITYANFVNYHMASLTPPILDKATFTAVEREEKCLSPSRA